MLNLKQLHYFHLIAKTASFARASEKANITQPALSNAIKSLEDNIGFSLFDRDERPVRLTPKGRLFYQHVDKLLFQAENVETSARYLQRGDEGHVRLGMTAAFAGAFGGEATAKWWLANPRMTISATVRSTRTLVERLLADGLDLIVGIASEMHSAAGLLELTDIRSQHGQLFVRSDHPLIHQRSIEGSDLINYGLAASYYAPLVLSQLADRFGFENYEDLPLIVNSDNIELLCDFISNCDVIMLGTLESTRHVVECGKITALDIDLKTFACWQIATRKGRSQNPRIRELADIITKVSSLT